jgi:FemAB-related protein (PEP-CTERM system-associated)
MPFLDAGGPAGGSPEMVRAAVERLVAEAKSRGAVQVELRSLSPLDLPVQPSVEKATLTRQLPSNPDLLWGELDAKVRNQIRKAERSGITVEHGGIERLDDFYRAFAVNMRDLGSPVHSKEFFRQIVLAFGSAAGIVIARKDRIPVGGLIAITHGNTRYVPWASTLRRYSSLCPNMLLYWEALRRACQDQIDRFDFGRSTRGSGTYRFKRQWGATDLQLYWYTVPMAENSARPISKEDAKWAALSRLWTWLPVSISRWIGPAIRSRLTQ